MPPRLISIEVAAAAADTDVAPAAGDTPLVMAKSSCSFEDMLLTILTILTLLLVRLNEGGFEREESKPKCSDEGEDESRDPLSA